MKRRSFSIGQAFWKAVDHADAALALGREDVVDRAHRADEVGVRGDAVVEVGDELARILEIGADGDRDVGRSHAASAHVAPVALVVLADVQTVDDDRLLVQGAGALIERRVASSTTHRQTPSVAPCPPRTT